MPLRPHITPESPRLFKWNILEVLSRTHPAVVAVFYLPLAVSLFWWGANETTLGLPAVFATFILGALTWTLTEYWLHRAIMHCVPDFTWGRAFHFWAHESHHKWPNDPYRLVMPIPVSLILFVLFFALYYWLLGEYVWSFYSGFTLSYVMYDVTHYWLHHGKSSARMFRALQKHHLSHHFNQKYGNLRFAVTLPLWDKVFGTNQPLASVSRTNDRSLQGRTISSEERTVLARAEAHDHESASTTNTENGVEQ